MLGRVGRLPQAAIRGTGALGLILVLSLVGAGAASASQAHAAKGAPIHLMVTGTLSGTTAAFPQIGTGASAAVDAINAQGGVNGHPLQLDTCDDQNSPALVQSCAEKAASNHDVAVVSGNDASSNVLTPVLTKLGIPFVGNITDSQADATSPISFPGSPGAFNGNAADALPAEKAGCKRAMTVTLIVAGATETIQSTIVAGLKAAHVPVVKEITVGESVTSFAPEIAAAQAVQADCIAFILDEPQTTAFMSQVKQSGQGLKLITAAIGLAPLTTLDGVANGVYLFSFASAPQETNPPAPLVQAESQLVKYGHLGSTNEINPVGLSTFGAVLLVADGLRQVHGAYTAKTELAALNHLRNASSDDIWPPYTTAGRKITIKNQNRVFNPDALSVKVEGDKEIPLGGFEPVPGI